MKETEMDELIETLRRQQALRDELRQSHRRLQSAVDAGPVRAAWHRENRRYYLRVACLGMLLAVAAEACTPSSDVARHRHADGTSADEVTASVDQIIDKL